MEIREKLSKIFNERAQYIAAFGIIGSTLGATVTSVAAAFTILVGVSPVAPSVAFAAAVMGIGAAIGSIPGTIAGFKMCKPESFLPPKTPAA